MIAASRSLVAVAVTAVVLGVGAGRSAAQQPSDRFVREFQAGVDAFRLGKYDDAIGHLEAARDLEPDLPGPHRFLAAVAAAQQRWEDCVTAARVAIGLNPSSSEIAATRKLHDDCRAALGLPGFAGDFAGGGAIAVMANVSGATVSIDGLKYGATPLAPRAIAVGEVEVAAEKTGWKTARAKVRILPGVVTDVVLELEEDSAGTGDGIGPTEVTVGWLLVRGPPGATVQVDGAAAAVDERGRYPLEPGDHVVDVSAPERVPVRRSVRVSRGQEITIEVELVSLDARRRRRRLGRIAVMSAVGVGAVGAVTGVLAIRDRDRARDLWTIETTRPTTVPISESSQVEPLHTRAEVDDLGDRADRLGLISNISYGVAAVALGVGVYLLATAPEAPPALVAPLVPAERGGAWGVTVQGALP